MPYPILPPLSIGEQQKQGILQARAQLEFLLPALLSSHPEDAGASA